MNKMNKKGFTLIEMLVVIAIIAVLVAIIIPVVGNSTAKAQAATDAANLRSAKATLTIAVLNGDLDENTDGSATMYNTLTGGTAPVSKSGDGEFDFKTDANGNVTVWFGTSESNNIDHYAGLAS